MIDKYTNSQIRDGLCAAAQADALLTDEEFLRCYEFHTNWADGVELAKFDNGGGDDFFIIFKGEAAVLKGFDHESELSPYAQDEYGVYPGIYDAVPKNLLAELQDEAIKFEDVTFCLWRQSDLGTWSKGEVDDKGHDDGSDWLLSRVIGGFDSYISYAEDYFEDDLTPEIKEKVRQIFESTCSKNAASKG